MDNLLFDGFLCSITTKIRQMELRGFNVSNCDAKHSVIGLSHDSGENAIDREAALPLNSSRVMAQTCSAETSCLPTTTPEISSLAFPAGRGSRLSLSGLPACAAVRWVCPHTPAGPPPRDQPWDLSSADAGKPAVLLKVAFSFL